MINEEDDEISDESKEDIEPKDYFDKYNTYYTLNIIISYLDEKSLFNLMPLKRRFYEVIQNKLNTEQNLYLPLYKHEYKYEYLDELFHVYYLSVKRHKK